MIHHLHAISRSSSRHTCFVVFLLALLTSLPAGAQPFAAGQCTISVLNQSARVQSDGTWNLPNVPANMGPVRARVTCVDEGQTLSGASDFFTITPSRMNAIPRVELGRGAATPETITLDLPTATLTAAGQTLQASVSARYPDGSFRDVTTAEEGTIYFSSNPAVATVDPEGLVTAVASGRALVSALHEAILSSVMILVLTSGDTDGDGMPDDFELASGLDPNDPVDRLEDRDRDGLLNGQEFDLGTGVGNADSDGDGIADGEEVAAGADGFLTHPLLADTDGDGVRDQLEIRVGTDPTDPEHVDYATVLVSLSAEHESLTLVKNTILPDEVSRRVRVWGSWVDGSVADLTARRTTFSSSDLSVASFGAEPGRVFAGADGTAIVTASNGGFETSVVVSVATFGPRALSFLPIPGFANGVAVEGSSVYVAAGITGLQVVDAADPRLPQIVGSLDTPGNANDVAIAEGWVYIADGERGLQVIDVGVPSQPVLVGSIDTPGIATDVVVAAGRAYVADGPAGLAMIDISDPTAPRLLGRVDTPGNARGVDVSGGFALVADGAGGVHVIDVTDPTAPIILGSVSTRATFSRAAAVAVRDRLVYVADGSDRTLGGLRVIDWSDPRTPALVASTDDGFGLAALALDRNVALSADYFFINHVPVFDLRQLTPTFRGSVDFSRLPSSREDNGNDVAIQDGVVYLVAARNAILDNGVTGDTGLHVGRYAIQDDLAGIAPSVRLTAPLPGRSILERRRLRLVATASDDVLVASVRFLANGQPVGEDFSPPYELDFLVPAGVTGPFAVGAVASDLAGNQGFAEEVVVNVVADTAPTVEVVAPLAGSRVVEGTTFSIVAGATDDVAPPLVSFFVEGALVGSRSSPPYRIDVAVPMGATELGLSVIATDGAGQTASSALSLDVVSDQPPTVQLLEPLDGGEVVAGGTVRVVAGASDDLALARVRIFVDGVLVADDTTAPFEATVTAPLDAPQITVGAIAIDDRGQTSVAPEQTLIVVPDPGATVRGRVVLEGGAPVALATVAVGGFATSTDGAGDFELADVPTALGPITVTAVATGAGQTLRSSALVIEALPGGITDVGEIVVRASGVVGYYDLGLNRGNATQIPPILTAGLEARDVGNLSTADLGSFEMLFIQNPRDSGYSATYLNNRPRLFQWIAEGGVMVFHDRHVTTAANALPGNPGTFIRSNWPALGVVDPTTLLTNGPGGVIPDSVFGVLGGFRGFAFIDTLPSGSRPVLAQRSAPDRIITYAYPHGDGWVIYSTIILDHYLSEDADPGANRDLFRLIYAPNVLAWANELAGF